MIRRDFTPWCIVDGCENAARARGLCNKHYVRWFRANAHPTTQPAGTTARRGTPEQFPCGHPRTPENSHSNGSGYFRCATCNREHALRQYHRKKQQQEATT